MINIDFLTLRAFFLENIDFLIGARLQKTQQPTRKDLIFSLRNNYESRKLYININPEIYHITFMSQKNETKRHLIIPQKPPMFCMLLRKYLEGNKISDAAVVDNERILELFFEITDELSQQRTLCLCVELMGKHSNIILYDKDSSIIIGCAHNVGEEKSRYRELQGGLKYIYPPKSNLTLSNELKKQFSTLTNDKINEYLKSESFRPAIYPNGYTLFSELIENPVPQNSICEMIDNYYSDIQEKKLLQTEKNRFFSIVNPKLKKVKSSIEKIENLLKKRNKTEIYKHYGELLTSNIYMDKNFESEVELYDYTTEENIIIPLDKDLTMNENAQKYFKLYSKYKNTEQKSKEILEQLYFQKTDLENILYSIEISDNLSDLEDIEFEIEPNNKNHKKTKTKEFDITKVTINDFDVYIGKNNRQNDYIISKIAKDDDIWFHTKSCAGSHVLLKVKEISPDNSTLLECCKIARAYSSAKMPSKVGIIYTKAKYLKKPPAAPLGYVTYKNETEVLV